MPKADATAEIVDAAKRRRSEDGAVDAAVLDSDLFSSLPPGNYIIYSGVYTDRRSAETGARRSSATVPGRGRDRLGEGERVAQAGDTTTSPDFGGGRRQAVPADLELDRRGDRRSDESGR